MVRNPLEKLNFNINQNRL